jgi:hypothetical protein
MIALFGDSNVLYNFMVTWKGHSLKKVDKFEWNNNLVHSRNICIEMEDLPKFIVNLQEIKKTIEAFKPVYEVCIV